jgi:divalent metal cation (Fe/Co/Zn/Cd) transporter
MKMIFGEHEDRYARVHKLEVASSGGIYRVHLSLGVPPALPVAEAHTIGRRLEEDIIKLFPEGSQIDLHIEPCDGACEFCHALCPDRKTD